MQKQRVFINYRTSDTGETASALYRHIAQRLGDEGSVFIDHDRIEGGEAWPKRLQLEVELATAMLCLIGKDWLGSLDSESRHRRLDMEEDWVRCEIRRALERNIPVIPVLVEGARLPGRKDLPEVLTRLPDLQARPLRRVEWDDDVDRILKDLGVGSSHYPETNVPSYVGSYSGAFVPWRRDVRGYLHFLIESMGERTRTNSVASLDPYIELAAEQRVAQTPRETEYPRERGYLVSLPQIRPAIAEIVGAVDRPQSITVASDVIGMETRTVRSVLNVLLTRHDPLVLLGEPGSGKSTTLRELVVQLARRALIFPGSPIPIYVELGRFRQRIDRDPNKTIIQLICDAVPPGVTNLRQHLAAGEITAPVAVIFDGMDEIPRMGDYADRTAALAAFATDYQLIARIVFACRTNDFDPSFGHQQLVLQPFDERRVRLFLHKTLGKRFEIDGEPQTARSAARRLMQVDELGAEAGNPLTLSLAVHFMYKHRKWPRGRAALFEDHLVALADKALRRQGVSTPPSDQLRSTVDAWAELAYEIFRQHGAVFIERAALEERVSDASVALAVGGGLVTEDAAVGLLKFRHHRLQEFLVARRLHLPNPPRPRWATILASPRWQETLLNYFAIGGRNNEVLTVILDSLLPAEEYFERLRPLVERSKTVVNAAQKAYDAIQPDKTEVIGGPVGGGTVVRNYSAQQQAKKDAAQKRLETVRRRHKRLRTLPTESEMAWSDHVLFAARVYALLKPPPSETPNLYDPIRRTLTGLLDFGRPAVQVRVLLAWRESAEWCPVAVLDSLRESPLDWVRSQTIHALASIPLQEDRVDRAFSEELERELLNLRLFTHIPIFWKTAPLRPGRRLQVMLAAVVHLAFVLLVAGVVAATGVFVAQRLSQGIAIFTDIPPALLWVAWLGLVGVVAVLTVPILRWSLITRVAAANAIAGVVTLVSVGWFEAASRLRGPITLAIWLDRLGLIFTALAVPLVTATALLSMVIIARLMFHAFVGMRNRRPGSNQGLYSFEASARSMEIGGVALAAGAVAAVLLSFDAPWVYYIGLGIAIICGVGSAVALIVTAFKWRWEAHKAKSIPKRVALIAVETLLGGVAAGVVIGIIIGVGQLLERFVRPLIPDWLPTVLLGICVWIILPIIVLFYAFFVGAYVFGAFGRTLGELRYLLFRRRLQRHPYRGNLAEWETAFTKATKLKRRELLESFDHRAMGEAPQDALKTLHRMEEFVELNDPAADVFHKTMYKLQEAIRQQRWDDLGDSHSYGQSLDS
jgi:hypothetical protein